MNFPGKIAIMGGGSWATALAKIMLYSQPTINWYMRRTDRIEEFKRSKHNPAYLTAVSFDVSRIQFYSDINQFVEASDTLIFSVPSPFLKEHLKKINRSMENKTIISAIKGLVPDENMLINDYFSTYYHVPEKNITVIGGACHAEEIAQEHQSFLTLAGKDPQKAELMTELFSTPYLKSRYSNDVIGIEYASTLKNVYAIIAGICHGMKYGDNYIAAFIPNAIAEMKRFINKVFPMERDITASAYLSDLLVTAYSKHSRNRTFGTMIGKGYRIKTAQLEMEMIAEGYYATKCIHEINEKYQVEMPFLDALYRVLYESASPAKEMSTLMFYFK